MLRVEAEAPPGAGTITHLDWDFDGSGRFVVSQSVEQGQTSVALTTTHAYDRPGTHFAVARVRLNREGDPDAARKAENLAAARIIVACTACTANLAASADGLTRRTLCRHSQFRVGPPPDTGLKPIHPRPVRGAEGLT